MKIALYRHTTHDVGLQPLNVEIYDDLAEYTRVSDCVNVDFIMLDEQRNIDINATLKSVFSGAQRDLERRHGLSLEKASLTLGALDDE